MTKEQQRTARIACAGELGWVRVRDHWEKEGESAWLNDSIHHRQLPNPLSLMDDAWLLVKRVQSKGQVVEIYIAPTQTTVTIFGPPEHFKGHSTVVTLPGTDVIKAAITEAFLRWRGRWKE